MESFLSNDLYKLTMGQAVWSNHPNAWVEYRFNNRSREVDLRPYRYEIERRIAMMDGVGPTAEEIEYLRGLGFFKTSYLAALAQKRLQTRYVQVGERDGTLDITVEGPWFQTIDFEVPILRAVNEAYFAQHATPEVFASGERRLEAKIQRFLEIHQEGRANPDRHPFELMEFGTRRAFSEQWQDRVVQRLTESLPPELFRGTSNVHLARRYGVRPQGTMAHEWLMAFQSFGALHLSQWSALNTWALEFRGRLGIALSDTVTFDQFLRDFDLMLANLFLGVRHDSGDPVVWGEKLIAHYEKLNIDPKTKIAAFTDSLDLDRAYELWVRFSSRMRCGFGIGTYLTNDLGPRALSIVMKMVRCNGLPLIKISDEPAKAMYEDPSFGAYAMHLFTEILPNRPVV